MKNAVRRNAPWPGGASAFLASRILVLFLAVLLAPSPAAAQSARSAAKANPRLASLQIELWPEYDRPASGLVILKGEIAADVRLPAAVSLRIPATSGGPTAVAYSAEPGGNLLNLTHDRKDAGGYITLKFEAPGRAFHIEFYEPISTSAPGRDWTHTWAGDLAADRLRLIVQEPATASDFAVEPRLEATATGQDALKYRSADLGPLQAGKPLNVKVRYTKADARTSTEIVKPPVPVSTSSLPPPSGPSKTELAVWLVVGVAGLGLGIWTAMMWWYGRERRPVAPSGDAAFCRKCGAPAASGDRYCAKCGAKLA